MTVDPTTTPTDSSSPLSPADISAARAIGKAAQVTNPPSAQTLRRIAAVCSNAATAASPPARGAAIGTPESGSRPVRSWPDRASQTVGDDAPTAA